jgi:hypothetical protein
VQISKKKQPNKVKGSLSKVYYNKGVSQYYLGFGKDSSASWGMRKL